MKNKVHYGFLFAGLATLMSASFQDNIRGPLLPVLCEQLGIPFSYGGLFLTLGNVAAVITTILMGKALQKYSEKRVTIFSCIFSALAGIIAPFVNDLINLMILGLVLGSSVALMGSICNILTLKGSPANLRGRLLSIQQVMYGMGSFLGPMSFAWFHSAKLPWSSSIVIVSLVNVVIALIIARVVPDEKPEQGADDEKPKLQAKYMVPIVLFTIYVAGEVVTSMWMSAYFVSVEGLSKIEASRLTSYFFLGISGTRFLCFLFLRRRWERIMMVTSLICGISFIIAGISGFPYLLPFAGILGPFFPIFMASVSHAFPKLWKSMTIWIFTCIQSGLAIVHLSVGQLTDVLGLEKAFYLAPCLITVSLILLLVFFRQHRDV